MSDDTALIQTLDFFTPVVDEPYYFGQIAAANSFSDVYAMGGKPITAMNIVCFPAKGVSKKILEEILKGGVDKINEAGAVLVGGHSVDDPEIKYGLSITGIVHPQEVLTNGGAKIGDALILTKPIGTGVIATAIKGGLASEKAIKKLIEVASFLNAKAAEIMKSFDVHSCTDVTGFGLAGHVLEMARASKKEIVLWSESVPLIEEAIEYAKMGLIPAGSYANKHFCEHMVEIEDRVSLIKRDLIFDPQTSGGLIIAIAEQEAHGCLKRLREEGIEEAAIIGQVIGDHLKGKLTIRNL